MKPLGDTDRVAHRRKSACLAFADHARDHGADVHDDRKIGVEAQLANEPACQDGEACFDLLRRDQRLPERPANATGVETEKRHPAVAGMAALHAAGRLNGRRGNGVEVFERIESVVSQGRLGAAGSAEADLLEEDCDFALGCGSHRRCRAPPFLFHRDQRA